MDLLLQSTHRMPYFTNMRVHPPQPRRYIYFGFVLPASLTLPIFVVVVFHSRI